LRELSGRAFFDSERPHPKAIGGSVDMVRASGLPCVQGPHDRFRDGHEVLVAEMPEKRT